MQPKRLALLAVLCAFLFAAGIALSWTGVLPGGSSLRGWFWSASDHANWVHGQHASKRIARFRSEQSTLPANSVVFLGSSNVERFPLSEIFPDKRCVNRGIEGDTIEQLMQRLDDSLPAAAPAAFFVCVGETDLRQGAVAALVRDRAAQLLDELQARYPDAAFSVIGLVPSVQAEEAERYEFELYNLALRRAAVTRKIPFVVTQREPIATRDGRLVAEYSSDGVHWNAAGYRRIGEWLLESAGEAGRLLTPGTTAKR